MGTDKAAHLVNVIDFGLAKKFRDSRTSDHIAYRQDERHGVGTSLFAAINTHLGIGALKKNWHHVIFADHCICRMLPPR
jgi:casein kinase I family protein HRR25